MTQIKIKPQLLANQIAAYSLMLMVTLFMAVPITWMLVTSVKPEGQVLRYPIEWIPQTFTLENYVRVFVEFPAIKQWFVNSFLVGIATVAISLMVYSLAAYPLAWMDFPGKRLIFLGILATMLIPTEATMVPLFLVLSKIRLGGSGISDSYFSLVMPVVANAFGLYLLVQFFQAIPEELVDAARIDGCNHLGVLWYIVLPLARPALTTVAIFAFMNSWNNFTWPFIVTNSDATRTLPVGMATFMGNITGNATAIWYGLTMAGSVISTIAPIIVFLFLQRYFVKGISMTGIKG